ncbi:hypothetical protein K2X83_02665 [Patescibacteria group bacterium]|nr:hypothetical protein [Patescibacteria group bacterium]
MPWFRRYVFEATAAINEIPPNSVITIGNIEAALDGITIKLPTEWSPHVKKIVIKMIAEQVEHLCKVRGLKVVEQRDIGIISTTIH